VTSASRLQGLQTRPNKACIVAKPGFHPVDTRTWPAQIVRVSKKPHKVGEPKATYAAKKPAKAALPKKSGTDNPEFKRIAGKLFTERKKLLHQLAQ